MTFRSAREFRFGSFGWWIHVLEFCPPVWKAFAWGGLRWRQTHFAWSFFWLKRHLRRIDVSKSGV